MLSIGNFDGVHLGHQALLQRLTKKARNRGCVSIAMTFDPPPSKILAPDRSPPQLTNPDRKAELLLGHGVDIVILYPTSRDLLDLSPPEFFDRIVRDQIGASGLVEGPNFFFGRDRQGNVEVLRGLCDAEGIDLEIARPSESAGMLISSSRIRDLILRGDVADAAEMLGRPYRLSGTVVTGAQRGRTLGFPTANLSRMQTLVPAHGVYAARCEHNGAIHSAAVHIGPNPTFGEDAAKVEVHLLDFSDDLYGAELDVDFLKRLREIRKFSGPDEVIEQIERDVAQTRIAFSALSAHSAVTAPCSPRRSQSDAEN
jgi:riboflavin kinase/FMN adenylyltransferase